MAYQKLQLKLLSKSGELLRCINCFAGQITVFRAYSSLELQPYQRALAGIPGPEKIAVGLDGDIYSPEKAVLIGFGEGFDPGQTVGAFLQSSGVPQAAIQMQLRNCGIEATEDSPCETLSGDFRRRLRLLAALYAKNQVLVLNNPFEDIASNWRERFAEELCSVTQNRNMIVIIPSLSYRPESWISNDFISRIQVGQNTQRTIGFGSDPSQMNDLVQQLRSSFGSEEEVQGVMKSVEAAQPSKQQPSPASVPPAAASHSAPSPPLTRSPEQLSVEATQVIAPEDIERATKRAKAQSKKIGSFSLGHLTSRKEVRRYAPLAIGVVGIALFLVGGGVDMIAGTDVVDQEIVEQTAVELEEAPEERPVTTGKSKRPSMFSRGRGGDAAIEREPEVLPPRLDGAGEQFEELPPAIKNAVSKNTLADGAPKIDRNHKPNPRAKYVLDLYPASVRTSVLKSFNSTTPLGSGRSGKAPAPSEPSKTGSQSDLFSLLQSTSGTGKDLPPTKAVTAQRSPGTSAQTSRKPAGSTLSREEIEERRKRIRQKFLEAIERRAQQRDS